MKKAIVNVYLKLNSYTEDKVAVGLMYFSEDRVFFDWSDSKVKWASKYLSTNSLKVLRKVFENFKKRMGSEHQGLLKEKAFKDEYLAYMKDVDDGLVVFSHPMPVAKTIDAEAFKKLFRLYIEKGAPSQTGTNRLSFQNEIKEKLRNNPVFKERADIDYKVSPSLISSIYKSHRVDFISVNGSVMAGFSLDFDQSLETIEAKFYEYRALSEGFEDFSKRKGLNSGAYLAFYNDPGEDANKRALLENASKDDTLPFTLKGVTNLEKTGHLLETKGYQKFSEFLKLENQ